MAWWGNLSTGTPRSYVQDLLASTYYIRVNMLLYAQRVCIPGMVDEDLTRDPNAQIRPFRHLRPTCAGIANGGEETYVH